MEVTRKTALAHKSNFGGTRALSSIRYIVLHYTANDGDSGESNAKYFQKPNRNASAHYFVDDDSITQSVPDNFIAWSVGGKKYTDCEKTGGGKLYGTATNANSISIEMCDTKKDGKLQATEKTMKNAAALCMELMEKYHIDISRVIRHFDVNGKHCPAYFMDATAWEEFKNRLRKHKYKTGQTYITTQSCYLRKNAGTGKNTVLYNSLSEAVRKKCRNAFGHAVFKKGKTFRLRKVTYIGEDAWGQMKSGYWVPLVHKGKVRAKMK